MMLLPLIARSLTLWANALAADRAVSDLMGNQVEKRKDFIQTHAKDVRFLDI